MRGTTDFMRAAALLDIELVERMLAAGTTDLETCDVLDQTPLLLLSRNRYSPSDVPRAVRVIERLIAAAKASVGPNSEAEKLKYLLQSPEPHDGEGGLHPEDGEIE